MPLTIGLSDELAARTNAAASAASIAKSAPAQAAAQIVGTFLMNGQRNARVTAPEGQRKHRLGTGLVGRRASSIRSVKVDLVSWSVSST
jgi:hypothetical protein